MRIAIVGTGNLAYALIHAFRKHTDIEVSVYGRKPKKVLQLQRSLGITPISKEDLCLPYDLVILAITDTAIESFSNALDLHSDTIVVHTSGATTMNALSKHPQYGIFYPLYSFPKKRKVSFSKVPMLLDYSSAIVKKQLFTIAERLSNKLYEANDQERLQYHLSAVFANNFANHLLTKAYEILNDRQLEKEVLLPIIKQSCRNWSKGLAETTQTGPAIRNDTRTLNKHCELLGDDEISLEIYDFLTQSIQNYYKKKES